MMTQYADTGPYEAPDTLEDWLEKRGISQTYASVFTWSEAEVRSNYETLFNEIEAYNERVEALTSEFQSLHQSRGGYMEEHGINSWQQLDPVRDAEHLTMKDSFFDRIRVCNTEGNRLKKERADAGRAFPLLAGIIDGSYSNFSSIINDERITHGLLSSNSGDPMWDHIGPLHNIFWSMYPKLV